MLALPNLRRVYLDQLPLLDSANPRLWLVGLILAEAGSLARIADKIKDYGLSHRADSVDWLELLETILVYKLPKLTREEILDMFNFNDISIQETRYYQDAVERGLAKGMAQGMEQGMLKGEAAVLLRQLERKFKSLPETARQRIAEADAETLLLWAERVLDAQTLDEVWGL